MTRISQAMRWLGEEISATPDEFRRAHHPGGDMLLTALLTGDLARRREGRVALTESGHRMLEAEHGDGREEA